MEASNRCRGKARFYKAQLKVRPKDNRLSRRAFQHLALTSCQQLRKASRIEGRSRVIRRAERWEGQHRHRELRLTCLTKRLAN